MMVPGERERSGSCLNWPYEYGCKRTMGDITKA